MRKTKDYIVTYQDSYLKHTWDVEVTARNTRAARRMCRNDLLNWAKYNDYPAPTTIARNSKILDVQLMDDMK